VGRGLLPYWDEETEAAVAQPDRIGSSMSSKQIAYAATAGRQVTFLFLAAAHAITGYVVGMDDYHWLVARVQDEKILPCLIHKGSADVIELAPEATFDSETDVIKIGVTELGRGFWDFCERTYQGRTEKHPSESEREPAR
jgi:hypothetical protein